jgi:pimeloyl-ACP methyl ester carboxylesterase
MRGLIVTAFAAFMIAAGAAPCAAERVSIEHLGLGLTANLEIAPGKSLKSDGAVLIVHNSLGSDRMEPIATLQDALRDQGVNTLAITLGLGFDSRKGNFNCALEQAHHHEDAIDEIADWVKWLKDKGAASITVAGHGRGANQVALYAINRLDKSVKRVVLMAPLMQTEESAEAEYRAIFKGSLRQYLGQAEELVANQNGNQFVNVPGFLTCSNPAVTASAFANYYASNPKFKTTNLLPSIKLPVLIAVGDGDPALPEIKAAEGEFSQLKTVTLSVVPGTDQNFHDLGAEELAKKVREFLFHRVQG